MRKDQRKKEWSISKELVALFYLSYDWDNKDEK